MELLLYIIIAIIWGIVSLIQKVNKDAKKTNKSRTNNQRNRTANNKNYNKNKTEEEIFRDLKKNMESLRNYSEDTLRKNVEDKNVYNTSYQTSDNDIQMLELQKKYNSKVEQINNIKNDTVSDMHINTAPTYNRHVNNMLSSLDIKNAIIYNAILEPKRINYTRIRK
ncbi:hypothetical protein [uncultured Brachyspira sp.]|uniref:hypothetical protein n=1 Tax=uncultured Brachyspira sp. TaxID=221953 RepID=UPI00262662C6|nr:hypothetical protein [uncultured Brachyspira sp.]